MIKRHNADPQTDPFPSKICGGPCGQRLALTEYPVNNSRPDKRGLYCKTCTIEKVNASRTRAGEYRARQALIALRRPDQR